MHHRCQGLRCILELVDTRASQLEYDYVSDRGGQLRPAKRFSSADNFMEEKIAQIFLHNGIFFKEADFAWAGTSPVYFSSQFPHSYRF